MASFKNYMAAGGKGAEISAKELDALVERYAWFSVARTVRAHLTGEADDYAAITAGSRSVSSLKLYGIDSSKLYDIDLPLPKLPDADIAPKLSTDEIIDRFLQSGEYRIVADDSSNAEDEIVTQPDFSDEDDIVTEELAQIYMSQGLFPQAIEIYRKLSLLNPKKSVYFAEIIDKIENNN